MIKPTLRQQIKTVYGHDMIAIRRAANAEEIGPQVWYLNNRRHWRWLGSLAEVCRQLSF